MVKFKMRQNERAAVLKGGRIVHVLPVNENGKAERMSAALCGRAPSEQRGGCFKRAGWYGTGSDINCPRCVALLEGRDDG